VKRFSQSVSLCEGTRDSIFKPLRSPQVNSKESIQPAYVASRAGQPYFYSIPSPRRLLKIPAHCELQLLDGRSAKGRQKSLIFRILGVSQTQHNALSILKLVHNTYVFVFVVLDVC
jgi:hypothetical protein